MKKILSFLLVVVATATAHSGIYNTELLADPSFEASESPWGNYYWGEDGATDVYVSDLGTSTFFDSGAQVDDGSYSIMIEYPAAATPTWPEDGFKADANRNTNNDYTSNEGVDFTKVNIQSVSYNAGDTLNASLRVYVDQWDATSNGIGVRVLGNAGVLGTSSFVSSPTGEWQTVDLSHTFGSNFTGELNFEVRYDYNNDGSGTLSRAFIDSASMKVIPEPSTLMTLALGAMILLRFARARRNS
jgi:hypothetical protein